MCLIAFAIGTRPDRPLVLASNRDEFFDRPTSALHRWSELPAGIWAGRDQQDGGTWLGVSETGRVALLTNVRSARPAAGERSRGELAVRWLQGEQDIDTFAAGLSAPAYGGFNLVVGDLHHSRWTWLSNRNPGQPHTDAATPLQRKDLGPGLYGLSNAALDTPWPKTQRLKSALARALDTPLDDAHWWASLLPALGDSVLADELPRTGVPAEWEEALSSPFVRAPGRGYGTRSSLVMRVRTDEAGRHIDLHEWTHSPSGWSDAGPTHHRLKW